MPKTWLTFYIVSKGMFACHKQTHIYIQYIRCVDISHTVYMSMYVCMWIFPFSGIYTVPAGDPLDPSLM